MRTSLDFPDPLFRQLKATAAMRGVSLRDHVLGLIERGMAAPPMSTAPTSLERERNIPILPSIRAGHAMPAALASSSHADLMALLDE